MTDILKFDEVLKRTEKLTRLHLILGNGFSIAKFPRIFSYNALFSMADFSANPRLKRVFERNKTHDFENVMKYLVSLQASGGEYGMNKESIEAVKKDIEALKTILIETICNNHPDSPNDIDDEDYKKSFDFLWKFLQRPNSHIYTLNYDLLLYWTLARVGLSDDKYSKSINDGFSNPEGDVDADYVTWQGEGQAFFSRVRYPHGALHIFDAGNEIKKITYSRTNLRLIEQTREALDSNLFPLFVSEGSSQEKLEKIKHNAYLYTCYQQFSADIKGFVKETGDGPDTAVLIYGHSLNSVDDHFWAKLMRGKVKDVYVSVHGGLSSEGGLAIQQNVQRLRTTFPGSPVRFIYFDAGTASVW
jgi:hypothetical protein